MAEQADALASGANGHYARTGSSPVFPTTDTKVVRMGTLKADVTLSEGEPRRVIIFLFA